jgi:hypothetical protein
MERGLMKVINKLYNGEIELNFDSFKHSYNVGGESVPSVTKILSVINKPALVNWSARVAVEYVQESINPGEAYDELQLNSIFEGAKKSHWQKKKDAGDIGTLVHAWIEKYINGENPGMPINEQLQDSVNNFLKWVKDHDVKFLLSEQPIYSRKYKYAGILDFICTIDGELYIGDIKTSSGIYPEYMLQTSAYKYARQEEYPEEKYVGQVIVRVGKEGDFETQTNKDDSLYKEMFRGFLSAQKLQEVLDRLSGGAEEWSK